ncbi:spore coat U domain-containing protein [Pseudomonas chengduensis]|nr:spore coat U domain-containing protein [Pseudomonas chengduensis]MDH1867236.1 spore coat U domain-containing protein [Pseudomonas chengduensis]
MNSNLLKTTLVAAAGLLFANSTLAATATTTFQVTATVAASCLVSATDLNFGAYNPLAGALDGTSTITATCTAQTPYTIGLDAGLNAGGTTTRRMIGDDTATTLLSYELYSDTTRSAIWGAPGGATVAQSALTGGALNYTVYGRIPASQYVPAASYADTVTVTVTY